MVLFQFPIFYASRLIPSWLKAKTTIEVLGKNKLVVIVDEVDVLMDEMAGLLNCSISPAWVVNWQQATSAKAKQKICLATPRGMTSVIRMNGQLSEEFLVERGVKQGGVLSPFLFNVYIDVVARKLQAAEEKERGDKARNVCLLFADDLAVVAAILEAVNGLGLQFNAKKSVVLVHGKKVEYAAEGERGTRAWLWHNFLTNERCLVGQQRSLAITNPRKELLNAIRCDGLPIEDEGVREVRVHYVCTMLTFYRLVLLRANKLLITTTKQMLVKSSTLISRLLM
ncbi:Reverse transcriptase domain-containing protein [Balamuthia mandrillaris]